MIFSSNQEQVNCICHCHFNSTGPSPSKETGKIHKMHEYWEEGNTTFSICS